MDGQANVTSERQDEDAFYDTVKGEIEGTLAAIALEFARSEAVSAHSFLHWLTTERPVVVR